MATQIVQRMWSSYIRFFWNDPTPSLPDKSKAALGWYQYALWLIEQQLYGWQTIEVSRAMWIMAALVIVCLIVIVIAIRRGRPTKIQSKNTYAHFFRASPDQQRACEDDWRAEYRPDYAASPKVSNTNHINISHQARDYSHEYEKMRNTLLEKQIEKLKVEIDAIGKSANESVTASIQPPSEFRPGQDDVSMWIARMRYYIKCSNIVNKYLFFLSRLDTKSANRLNTLIDSDSRDAYEEAIKLFERLQATAGRDRLDPYEAMHARVQGVDENPYVYGHDLWRLAKTAYPQLTTEQLFSLVKPRFI